MNATEFQQLEPSYAQYNTPANFQILADSVTERAKTHGLAISTWKIVFNQLRDKTIKPIAGWTAPVVPVSREFRQRCASLSSSEVRRLYNTDPAFHSQWDRMSLEDDGGTIREVPDDGTPVELTARQYKQMDPNLLARLLQDPATRDRWQAAINKLIAEGTI